VPNNKIKIEAPLKFESPIKIPQSLRTFAPFNMSEFRTLEEIKVATADEKKASIHFIQN